MSFLKFRRVPSVLGFLGFAFVSFAIGSSAQAQFLPKNNLAIQNSHLFSLGLTEKQFNQVVQDIISEYRSEIENTHGAKIDLELLWDDEEVNASAWQDGRTWRLTFYGGLFRRPEMTLDAFSLVVCHELGHHLGGFPFKFPDTDSLDWAASEGQSDYFATQACLKRLWKNKKKENAAAATNVHAVVKSKCDVSYKGTPERNLCYRIGMAGLPLAQLLAALNPEDAPKEIGYDKRDPAQVTVTDTSHPLGQCRLDTFMEGNLCTAEFEAKVIPGRRHAKGQASVAAEQEAATRSCTAYTGFKSGLRPRCWYAPRL